MDQVVRQGYFSLLRWRSDPARDEARNVAVILVDEAGAYSGVRGVGLSSISPRLRDQGLIDDVLAGLEERAETGRLQLSDLEEMHGGLQRSLVMTKPKRAAIRDPDETLVSLYRRYLAQRGGGTRRQTKSVVLDHVVRTLRDQGYRARQGRYIGDFIFDVVIDAERPTVMEVLSFAAERKDWTPLERDAGHFLLGVEHLDVDGRAVIQPPRNGSPPASYRRIQRLFESFDVPMTTPEELENAQQALDIGTPA